MVQAQPIAADFSPLLEGCRRRLRKPGRSTPNPASLYRHSPRLPRDKAIAAYVRSMLKPSMTVRQIAETLCSRIHKDFKYDAEATTVDTTPAEAFAKRRGVCQDFSHVMIVALRSLGIPAGYVSGFLRTIPPRQGEAGRADAMHAWVRVWCGKLTGWLELDPQTTSQPVRPYRSRLRSRLCRRGTVIGVLKSYGSHRRRRPWMSSR